MLHEFAVNLPRDKSVAAVCQSLSAAGLCVEQSFNLRAALALVPNGGTCPHHGTAMCARHTPTTRCTGRRCRLRSW